jgi:hypothetical protein
MKICYPLCIQKQIRNSESGFNATRCQDENDIAFCDFLTQTNIANQIPVSNRVETVIYESFGIKNNDFPVISVNINIEDASFYVVEVDEWTDISYSLLRACTDARCREDPFYESASDSLHDSIAGVSFTIMSPSFYLYLEPRRESYGGCPRAKYGFTCFGYSITVTAAVPYSGWKSCSIAPLYAQSSIAFNHLKSKSNVNLAEAVLAYANDFCSWQGVTCDTLTSAVVKIDLSSWGLEGPIPSTIGYLKKLQYLNLANNKFTGTLPTVLGTLTDLVELQLQRNSLTGSIPTTLSSMGFFQSVYASTFKVFDVSFNAFSGTLNGAYCGLIYNTSVFEIAQTAIECYDSCWDRLNFTSFVTGDINSCAPSSMPTSHPTDGKKNVNSTSSLMIIVIAVVTIPVALCIIGICVYVSLSNRMKRRRVLATLPIHKSIVDGAAKELILDAVHQHASTALIADFDGKRAIDYAISKHVNDEIIYELVKKCLPYHEVVFRIS